MSGITNPAEEYFKDGGWGWDGTAWRKLNLTFGYYARLIDLVSNLNASAGVNWLTHQTVPAGEVWVVTAAAAANATSASAAELWLFTLEGNGALCSYGALAPGVSKTFSPAFVVMSAGDYIRTLFTGCVAGDDIYSSIIGYKMKV